MKRDVKNPIPCVLIFLFTFGGACAQIIEIPQPVPVPKVAETHKISSALTASPIVAAVSEPFQLLIRYPIDRRLQNRDIGSLENVNDLQLAGNRLWVATNGGLLTQDVATQKWAVVWDENKDLFTSLHRLSVSGSVLWAASGESLFRLDLLLGNVRQITTHQGLLPRYVENLSAGSRWVWVSYGADQRNKDEDIYVTQFSPAGKYVKNWTLPPDTKHRSQYFEDCCWAYPQSSPLAGLRRFWDSFSLVQPAYAEDFYGGPTPEAGNISTYLWTNNHVIQILSDHDYLWIVQAGRILRLNVLNGHYDIWNLSKIYGQRLTNALQGKVQILKQKGKVTVADDNHWIQFDTTLQKWSQFLPKPASGKKGKHPDTEDFIKPKMHLPVASGDGLVWVGSSYDLTTSSRFVLRYLKDHSTDWKDEEVVFNPNGTQWVYHALNALLPVNGDVWMGTSNGLYRYQLEKQKLYRVEVSANNPFNETTDDNGGITFTEENAETSAQESVNSPQMSAVTPLVVISPTATP